MMNLSNLKFYKIKRPKEGYNTEQERAMAEWSDVSDWELFCKDELIGHIYYVGTLATQWAGYLEDESIKVSLNTRKEVFNELVIQHQKRKAK